MSCPNKQTLILLKVTTTENNTPEEAEEEAKEALASKVVAAKQIAEITHQLPNHHLKENYKIRAYPGSLSPNAHIEPHNSRKSMILCQSYVQTRVTSILTMQFATIKSWIKR